MSEASTYRLGADIGDQEDLHDRQGRRIDDAYVHEAVSEALTQVRGRGRPSLSESGESPLLRVRISRDLDDAVRRAADAGALECGVEPGSRLRTTLGSSVSVSFLMPWACAA